jgi:hypothetical protein
MLTLKRFAPLELQVGRVRESNAGIAETHQIQKRYKAQPRKLHRRLLQHHQSSLWYADTLQTVSLSQAEPHIPLHSALRCSPAAYPLFSARRTRLLRVTASTKMRTVWRWQRPMNVEILHRMHNINFMICYKAVEHHRQCKNCASHRA